MIIVRLLMVVVLVLACANPAWPAVPLEQQTKEQLERTKLRAEITKLQDESGRGADFARVAPAVTAFVAIIGILATLWKQIGESSRQKEQDRAERDRARTQRFDEQFERMVENLGSTTNSVRAAAAAQIPMFLRAEYEQFHEQVFTVLLATLRFPRSDVGDRILARAFQRVAPSQIQLLHQGDANLELDLSHCYLAQIDLSGVDLSNADVAFADMHGTILRDSRMYRVRGFRVNLGGARLSNAVLQEARLAEANLAGAQLHNARLISANLKGIDASGASFQGAKLQEAHFESAILRGARFEGADVNNAYFAGAQLDDVALQSIATGAKNWRKANLDDDTKVDLEQRSKSAKT